MSYSSSSRDHGVRSKKIDLTSGKWDVFDITYDVAVESKALLWFQANMGASYDYRNILRFILPFAGHNSKQFVCYEACGAALGIPDPHKLDADTLLQEALRLYKQDSKRR
jgi:hypothetical protein